MNKAGKVAVQIAGFAAGGAVLLGFWKAAQTIMDRIEKNPCALMPYCTDNYSREMPRFKNRIAVPDAFPLTRS